MRTLSRVSSFRKGPVAAPRKVSCDVHPPRPGLPQEGQFYVDSTCIDCDVCRWMEPGTFARVQGQTAVVAQPDTKAARVRAMQATLACPTFSIHMRERDPTEFKEAQLGIPIPVEGCQNVYHLAFHSVDSFSATSYLIVRPEGNIMMDCPRWSPFLARKIESLGGVAHIVLSHIDDLGDHDRWAAHFGCPRVIHQTEVRRQIADIEVQLRGTGPWNLKGEVMDEDNTDGGVLIIHTPGHTSGSICLWHEASRSMFTGDSYAWSETVGRSSIFPRYNRDGIAKQLASVRKLLQWDYMHVLPGHGRRMHIQDAAHRLQLFNDVYQAEMARA